METVRRSRENWFDDTFVAAWLVDQQDRTVERLRQFAIIRSLIPRSTHEPFRYLNIGAGDGWLDELLLSRFTSAAATLVDGSALMVDRARARLASYGGRVHVVQTNLASPEWGEPVGEDFDLAVSTIAIHNLREAARIRTLYAEVFRTLAPKALFLNLDYARPVSPVLAPLSRWAHADPEHPFLTHASGGGGSAGTVEEQLVWLREAGFAPVDCLWKEFQVALFGGAKGALRVPDAR